MTIDITQFQQTFFEESFEGLEVMESGLLHLEVGRPDAEVIHTIFRTAHSIKGGSGTFGFVDVMAFTHLMETLLDDIRDGQRQVTQATVELLLQSVDCLRDLLIAARDRVEIDQQRILHLQQQYEALLAPAPESTSIPLCAVPASGNEDAAPATARSGWHIRFRPYPHLLRSGNDPVRIFRELETLGHLTVQADTSHLPSFPDLDPEECHLSWALTLHGAVSDEQVQEVFAWVEGDWGAFPFSRSPYKRRGVAELKTKRS